MLRRRWREVRRDDRGMTLVELVVGMSLLSIVGALALNFFVGMSAQASRVTAQSQDGAAARTAMNQIATVLRVADTPTNRAGYSTSRFLLPTGRTQLSPTEIVFFSNVASGGRAGAALRLPPTKFDIALLPGVAGSTNPADGPRLVEYSYAPSSSTTYGVGNYPSTPTSTTVLLAGVQNTDVFTYCTSATDVATRCTAATTTDSIAVVQVKLAVQALRGNARQTVQSAIAITGAVS